MNDIKIGQLYKHTPTGIVRRVVFADSNHVTFKEDATFTKFYCSTKDFKKFWKPYKENNKTSDDKVNHPSHYTWLKDLCGIEVIDITRHMDFMVDSLMSIVDANDSYICIDNGISYRNNV